MFILKKNSYTVMLLSKFLFRDCLYNAVVFTVLVYSVSVCNFPTVVFVQGAGFFYLLLLLVHAFWFVRVMRDRKAWGAFLPWSLRIVALTANVYYLGMMAVLVRLSVAHHDIYFPERLKRFFLPGIATCWDFMKQAAGFLPAVIILSFVLEFVLSVVLVFYSATGGIVQFYLLEDGKKPVHDLKHTIDGKTGVRITSSVPKYNRLVDVAGGYFSITADDNLVIAGAGGDAVFIPKGSVKDITFTTLAGWKTKVGYSGGIWKRL